MYVLDHLVMLAPKGSLAAGEHATMLNPVKAKAKTTTTPKPVVLPLHCVHHTIDERGVVSQCRRPVARHSPSGFLCEDHQGINRRIISKEDIALLPKGPRASLMVEGESIALKDGQAIQKLRESGKSQRVRLVTDGINSIYMEIA